MVLILRPRTDIARPDAYQVVSGDATVGIIHLATVPPGPGLWMWSITNFHVHPVEREPGNGLAATREAAMREFAARRRSWLEWAALQEMDPLGHGGQHSNAAPDCPAGGSIDD